MAKNTFNYNINKSSYGCMSFVGDLILTLLTGGLWLIWIFIREMRRK